MELDLTNPEVKAAVDALIGERQKAWETEQKDATDKAVSEATAGLVQKRDELLEETKRAKAERDGLKQHFGNRDPEEVASLVKKLEDEELAQLVRDGDLEAYNAKIVKRTETDYQAKLDTAATEMAQMVGERDSAIESLKVLKIDDRLKTDFLKHGGAPSAVEDMVRRGRDVWDLDDDGELVAKDSKGDLLKGKDGLLQPAEWIQGPLRDNAEHLFVKAEGSGASGSSGAPRKGGQRRSEMSSKQAAEFIKEHGQAAYLELAA